MKTETYRELFDRQQKEVNDFPIAYAFNEEQLKQALEKLGAKDVSECVTYLNMGDVMLKKDIPAFEAMMERHREEMLEALKDKEFAYEAFVYEMDNHEYEAEECADIAGEEPAIEEPIDARCFVFVPFSHRTHPPIGGVVAWQSVGKESGRVDEVDRHWQGSQREQIPCAPPAECNT